MYNKIAKDNKKWKSELTKEKRRNEIDEGRRRRQAGQGKV